MPLVVDDKGSVVANPTTGKTFSRKSGVELRPGLLEDVVSKAANELEQKAEKKESKNRDNATSRQVAQPTYSAPASVGNMPMPRVETASTVGVKRLTPDDVEQTDDASEESELNPQFGDGSPTIHTAWMAAPQSPSDIGFRDSTRANDVYENDMIDSGLSVDYIDNVLKEDNAVKAALDNTNELEPEWRRDLLDQLTTSVDDGTMDRQHLLSDWMTGKQYYHYVHDLGIPGMPEKQIDVSDGSRYSKTEQQQLYGFVPYVPNNTYLLARDFILTPAAATRRLSDHISNLRTRGLFNDVDYDIGVDTGYDHQTFSGREYERMSPGYFSQTDKLYNDAADGDADALATMISDPGDGPYTTMVKQTELPDGSLHYGVVTKAGADYDIDMQDLIDEGTVAYNDDGVPISMVTKDGFVLDIVPTSDGYDIDTKNDAFQEWNDSHLIYHMEFSDGSSAELPLSDISNDIARNGRIGELNWVRYDDTGLNIDPRDLTVGKPTKLNDSYDPFTQSGAEVGAYFSPDMVLPDGTRIPRDVAEKISSDTNPDDTSEDGISYSFQRSGLNPSRGILGIPHTGWLGAALGSSALPLLLTDSRPRHLMKQAPVDDEGLHILDLPNNLADWAANSATISLPYAQWVNAFSQAMPYYAGVQGQNRDETGRYSSTGFDPGDDKNALMSVPVLAGPALENLAGNIGHETWLDKPVNSLIDRQLAKGTLSNVLAHHGFDMFGEGIEENFGDIVDELFTYGRDAYANPVSVQPDAALPYDMNVYDEDGNLVKPANADIYGPLPPGIRLYDEHGQELRDSENTTDLDRVLNFVPHTPEQLRDAANSFLGGAGVSALMGGPSLIAEGVGSQLQKRRGDWGSQSYAAHMNALNREFPYAGKSLGYARNDARRRYMGETETPGFDVRLPESLLSNPRSNDGSDIIRYEPGKYAISDDARLPELK